MTENEPLEFQIDSAEDRLTSIDMLMSKLISNLARLDQQKRDTINLIESLHYEIEKNQASA